MDDQTSTSIAEPESGASQTSVSARLAAAIADPHNDSTLHIPYQERMHSVSAMAERDLDAALQLLADRAQYITGASGAAIALRRGPHNDMLCRASVGANAPELGALLSMEYGLSGESVRTRRIQRCDDAEHDSRVSSEACRRLGIASVAIMPIVCEEQAVGVFELFSGRPHAFVERDFAALQRLSGLVETAVEQAITSQRVPADRQHGAGGAVRPAETMVTRDWTPDREKVPSAGGSPAHVPAAAAAPLHPAGLSASMDAAGLEKTEKTPGNQPGQPLYWSVGAQAEKREATRPAIAPVAVPAMLRNLKKCQACGFPVSHGRTLCVECEEKQWRGVPVRRID